MMARPVAGVCMAAMAVWLAAGPVLAQQEAFSPPRPQPGDVMKHWPAYPDEARLAGQEGTVLLRLKVTPAGDPQDIAIARSSASAALDLAAVVAVSRWKFSPATRDGKPVEADVTLPIRFSLTDNPPGATTPAK